MTLTDWLGPQEWQAVRLSLRVAGVAMLASLPFAVTVAWLLARRRFPGHGLLSGIVHLPLVLPPVVTGYLLLLTFGKRGLVVHHLLTSLDDAAEGIAVLHAGLDLGLCFLE